MSTNYDVIIIGGGINGNSTALELARRGLRVALLEKSSIGEGPTGRSSAIIRQHYSNELTIRMAKYSLDVFRHFDDVVGGEAGFHRAGFAVVVEAKDTPGLEANVALQQSLGVGTSLISPTDLSRHFPGIAVDDVVAAAYEPDSGYADPYLTVTSYAQAARAAGVEVLQNTAVTEILFENERVNGVATATASYHAPRVVNCAGAWGHQVAEMAGTTIPLNACRVQVAYYRRPPGHEAPHPVVADFSNAIYFRSETGGLTLVGLIDPEEANAVVDPDRFPEGVDNGFILDAGERLIRRYPAMEYSDSAGGYASLYDITPDWHPIIDEVPAGSGHFLCVGFSGHGFKLGPAIGRLTADLVEGVSEPLFSAELFRLARFAENQPIRGRYEYSIVG